MRFRDYFKDRIYSLVILIVLLVPAVLLMRAYRLETPAIVAVSAIFVIFFISEILIDFFRKKKFYDTLLDNTDNLDKKYLVPETIPSPGFCEGRIIESVLRDTGKSMADNVNVYRQGAENFKEYVEMWIHEIKLPISSMTLILHNSHDKNDRMLTQVRRINNLIEQILYYVRSENAEKDYIIDECSLARTVGAVAVRNKDDILEHNIDFQVSDVDVTVYTDAKWLEFMLNQILSNSIKYKDDNKDTSVIRISAVQDKKSIELRIYDNGIGISGSDIPRVFDKSFTGENGRRYSKATVMGLYIVKKMCDKMGHDIYIESAIGEYTEVKMTFYKNDFYNVTKM